MWEIMLIIKWMAMVNLIILVTTDHMYISYCGQWKEDKKYGNGGALFKDGG